MVQPVRRIGQLVIDSVVGPHRSQPRVDRYVDTARTAKHDVLTVFDKAEPISAMKFPFVSSNCAEGTTDPLNGIARSTSLVASSVKL